MDYLLMNNKDRRRIMKCDIGLMDLSDHSPVDMTLNLNNRKRNTLWRLNSGILTEQVKGGFKKEIKLFLMENDTGEVEAGEVEAGEVEAGEVEAGEVEAGEVDAAVLWDA
ncbi:hypothetical protein NHX12_017339 [Muraenolepis orangiensis]|uniref:Uncharacterized protein n=1 Tax=Muraenolepis orangiensis TaxID=630683 RepID=A0A9Q0D7X6_9TELE|nr:hypothetical protein NHX12_017339 [Muraenolepis orangiensis]